MEYENLTAVVEAVLFAAGDPLEISRISQALGETDEDVANALSELSARYQGEDCGICLLNLNGKYQLATKREYIAAIRACLALKNNTPLSSAAMEVLAIVAYNQPVTKSFIDQVRAVDCTSVINTLCQKNLIEEAGRLDLPGRPLVYCTTIDFLRCFGLKSLEELPEIPKSDETEVPSDGLEGQMSIF